MYGGRDEGSALHHSNQPALGKRPWVSWKLCMARPSCFMLLEQRMRPAASRTFWTAGSNRPMRMAMMAITTSSSISVKPRRTADRGLFDMGPPLRRNGGPRAAPFVTASLPRPKKAKKWAPRPGPTWCARTMHGRECLFFSKKVMRRKGENYFSARKPPHGAERGRARRVPRRSAAHQVGLEVAADLGA